MSGQRSKHERRRIRRYRIRKRVSGVAARPRLSVFRSSKHIYAQIIDDVRGVTLAAASSREDAPRAGTGKLGLSARSGSVWPSARRRRTSRASASTGVATCFTGA